MHYVDGISTGLRPCRCCKPSIEDEKIANQNPITTEPIIYKRKTKKQSTEEKHPYRCLNLQEQRAVGRHRRAQLERSQFINDSNLTMEQRKDKYILTQPRFAFWAADGYRTFHLRNCKKLTGLNGLKGFSRFDEARSAGFIPCRCCKPSDKHDMVLSLPIYSREYREDTVQGLKELCFRNEYICKGDGDWMIIETPVGIWRTHTGQSPYRLEHINLIVDPNNRVCFHRQPKLFLSLRDIYYYIKRHDEVLILQAQT